MRKPVYGMSEQVQHKPACTATEDGYMLEISDLGSRGIVLYFNTAKTKALISCAVTKQLMCAFGFAYARSKFHHDATHFEPLSYENRIFAYAKTKTQISFAVTAKLISVYG